MDGAVASAARRRRRWRRLSATWPLLPLLLYLGFFLLLPVGQILGLSLVDQSGALSPIHYTGLFSSDTYIRVLAITLRVSLWTTVFALLAGYPVAYLLATSQGRPQDLLILAVLMPFWTSFLVRTFAWIVLLGRNGAINDMLAALGVTDAPLNMIYNFTGVMIGMVQALTPFAVLAMLSVMQSVDNNLVKAARTLGARQGQAFWRVYFPLSLPGVAAGGIFVFITALGFFITPALLGSGRDVMIAQVIIDQLQQLMNWGFAAAISVLLLLTALVAFILYDRLLHVSAASNAGNQAGSAKVNGRIGRMRSRTGAALIAALGWLSDRVGELVELVRPPRSHRPRAGYSRLLLWIVGGAVLIYLTLPSFFVIPVSFTESPFFEWPPRGFSLQWYEQALSSDVWRAATFRSLGVGVCSALLAMLIGVPAAFVLARQSLPGKTLLLAFIISPMVIPRIIIAVAIFYLYARIGLIGSSLGLVLGHAVISVPFVVLMVMATLKNYDARLDSAARSLGADAPRTLWHVTFPIIRPGLIAAFLFAFVTSFDELTIALFVSGGLSTTLPKQMWEDALLKVNPVLAAVSTLILIFITAVILVAEYARRKASRG